MATLQGNMKSTQQMILEAEQKWRSETWYARPEGADAKMWASAVREVATLAKEPPPDRIDPPKFRLY